MLTISDLNFGYRPEQRQIRDLTLHLEDGGLLGLLGPNGAGKTTLVSLLVGLLRPDSGRIEIDGHPARLGRTDVALVPQEYAFYPRLSGRENLNYFAGILQLAGPQRREAVDSALARCDLSDVQHRRAGQYSGGLKRRLNFAVALLQRPRLLILDEPTANMDPPSRLHLLQQVRQLNAEGVTVIYTSHLLSEVESLCRTIAVLDHGELVKAGTLSELLGEKSGLVDIHTTAELPDALRQLPGTRARGAGRWQFDLDRAGLSPGELLARLEAAGVPLLEMQLGRLRLEELFLSSTGREEPQ